MTDRGDGGGDAADRSTGHGEDSAGKHRAPARVRDVYDEIAEHFAETRAHPWPEVRDFLEEYDFPEASVGLDLGCGNGRHAALLGEYVETVLALDVSRALLRTARARMRRDGWEAALLQGTAETLPIGDDTVDLAVYVATLHHLPDREARVRSLSELARVLTDDGRGLVSVWSIEHERFDADAGFDTTIDWTLPDGETLDRFYHIYDRSEFETDLHASDLRIERLFVSSGNGYAVVRCAP